LARAALVVDDELLAGELRQLIADDSRQGVGRPARRKDVDVAHRLVRPVVGRAGDAGADHRGGQRAGRHHAAGEHERAAAWQDQSFHPGFSHCIFLAVDLIQAEEGRICGIQTSRRGRRLTGAAKIRLI
jgi:hypothetical protein